MPVASGRLFSLIWLLICSSAIVSGQSRVALEDLPADLAWSMPLDHIDGKVYALLTSVAEGTFLVQGDSAVWMSPLVYGHLTSSTEGLRMAAPSPRAQLLWPDSLVSSDGLRLEALAQPIVSHTAGGVVGGLSENLFLERLNLHDGQFGSTNWVAMPARRNGLRIDRATTDPMQNRSCADASLNRYPVIVNSNIWGVGDRQLISVSRVPNFDFQYLNHPNQIVGKSLLVTLMDFDSESVQTFTEVTGEPVSIVSDGLGFVLVTTRELVRFDSIGRERSHAYLPSGMTPVSAISSSDSQGDYVWIMDEGINGRGRISKVNSSFEFVESYRPTTAIGDALERFGLRSVNGLLPIVSSATSSLSSYKFYAVDPSDPLSTFMQPTTSPDQLSPKQQYPLPDTMPLVEFGRGFNLEDCTLIGDFDTVQILKDSSIWIDGPLWNELRGFSEQWLANWTPNLEESPALTLPTGDFYTDAQGVGFRNTTTDILLFENNGDIDFLFLGEVSPGYALVQKSNAPLVPSPSNQRTLELEVFDSLGRLYTYLFYDFPFDEAEVSISEAGVLVVWDESYLPPADFDRAFQINFVPLSVLKQPINLPQIGCGEGGQVELFWPDVPNQSGTFSFGNDGRLFGTFAGLGFAFYIENNFTIDTVLSQFSFIEPCGDLILGSLSLEIDSGFTDVVSYINREESTFLDSIQGSGVVQLLIRDTVTGCQIEDLLFAFPRSFSYSQLDPCFDQLGRVFSNSADTSFFEFPDSTYVSQRRNLPAGVYPITFRNSNGCSIDTTLIITEAPEIVLTVDSAFVNGVYELEVSVPDTLYDYTFSWTGRIGGTTATYPPGTVVNLSASQLGEHSRCTESLSFTLGGVSNIDGVRLADLSVNVDADGNLLLYGLEEFAKSQGVPLSELSCDVLDVTGRHLGSYQAFGGSLKIEQKSGHLVGPKFLSFGTFGGIGIIW